MNKIKKVVLREDYLSICDNANEAIVLAQMIYWSERVKDADKLLQEENDHLKKEEGTERELFHGWIYKSASQLEEELMGFVSRRTITNVFKKLIEKGFLYKRRNPKLKWDRTYQYRVDLICIAKELKNNGYFLEGYSLDLESEVSNAKENIADPLENIANGKEEIANRKAPVAKQYQRLLTEIKNKDYNISQRSFDELRIIFNMAYKQIYKTYYTFSNKDIDLIKSHSKDSDSIEKILKVFLALPYYYSHKLEESPKIEQYHFTPTFILTTFRFNDIISSFYNIPKIKLSVMKEIYSDEFEEFSKNYDKLSFYELNNPEVILEEFEKEIGVSL